MDRALIGLRHLWSVPPRVDDPALGSIDMSTIWIADALTSAEFRRADEDPTHPEGEGPQPEVTIGDLARALDVAHSTASRLVERAQASGAVMRHPSSRDARMTAVQLTGAGRELARTSRAFRSQHLERATDGWTEAERAKFADLLTRFAAAMAEIDHDRPPR